MQSPIRISLQADIDMQAMLPRGYCSQPRFSPNGLMIAFLRSPFGRALDVSIWIKHADSRSAIDVFSMVTGRNWNLIPDGAEFTPDSHALYIQAQDAGRGALYKLELLPNGYPETIIRSGTVSAYHTLCHDKDGIDKLLVTTSTLVEPWIYQICDTSIINNSEPWVISRASRHFSLGLSSKQVSEIYFEGAGDYVVHAWVVTPRDFDSSKNKYPLCLIVHGGPNGSWDDAWSTRVSRRDPPPPGRSTHD